MAKMNKCFLVVQDYSQSSRAIRFSCDAVRNDCTFYKMGNSSYAERLRDDGMEPGEIGVCSCKHIGIPRKDGTIPCLNKEAKQEVLRLVSGFSLSTIGW